MDNVRIAVMALCSMLFFHSAVDVALVPKGSPLPFHAGVD
jgi:hypothetical protein